MSLVSIALGANAGDRLVSLRSAVRRFDEEADVEVVGASSLYVSEAHTLGAPQPPYLNAVLLVRSSRTPASILELCQAIERAAGRVPAERWAPRTLDLDLLAVGPRVEMSDRLTLPHPKLAKRRFVLQPWSEIAPNFTVPPPFEMTVAELLRRCTDECLLYRMQAKLLKKSR